MRRACSREFRVCCVLGSLFLLQCSPASRTIKAALRDQARHAGRNQPVERLPGSHASPNARRGGRIRLELEEEDPLAPVELLEDVLQLAAREARPGRDRESRALEYLLG